MISIFDNSASVSGPRMHAVSSSPSSAPRRPRAPASASGSARASCRGAPDGRITFRSLRNDQGLHHVFSRLPACERKCRHGQRQCQGVRNPAPANGHETLLQPTVNSGREPCRSSGQRQHNGAERGESLRSDSGALREGRGCSSAVSVASFTRALAFGHNERHHRQRKSIQQAPAGRSLIPQFDELGNDLPLVDSGYSGRVARGVHHGTSVIYPSENFSLNS